MRCKMKYQITDLIKEVDYELSQRAKVYKRLIETKKMPRAAAEDHYLKMKAVKACLVEYGKCYSSVELKRD